MWVVAHNTPIERVRAVRVPPAGAQKVSEGYTAMLVLSRKKNESIVINSDIVITVIEIRGDKVRLGIVAPKDVPVHREEVYEAILGAGTDRRKFGNKSVRAHVAAGWTVYPVHPVETIVEGLPAFKSIAEIPV